MNKLIRQESLAQFSTRFWDGEYPHQRFGQAFCNEFDITDSKLFYTEDASEAADLMIDHVDWSYVADWSQK